MRKRGFTLVELLTVVSIIGILVSLLVVNIVGARKKAKVAQAKADVSRISLSIQQMYADTRLIPGGSTNVSYEYNKRICLARDSSIGYCGTSAPSSRFDTSLWKDGSTPITNWKGPYTNANLIDPWGHAYYINYAFAGPPFGGVQVVVMSQGPDTSGSPNLMCGYVYKSLKFTPTDQYTDSTVSGWPKADFEAAINSNKDENPACAANSFSGQVP